jgi:hypothetical protein
MSEWEQDCLKWRGVVLTGEHKHWCSDWDFLPIDETCVEWPCACATDLSPSVATAVPESTDAASSRNDAAPME